MTSNEQLTNEFDEAMHGIYQCMAFIIEHTLKPDIKPQFF